MPGLAPDAHDSEIFHTLQGEGASIGCPAVFIRASRCNLHCVWCDTDHTWNFEGTPWPHEKDALPGYQKHRKSDVTVDLNPIEAAEIVLSYQCPRVVITGGEPLLQQDEFLEMIHRIHETMPGCSIEVETNGTRIPSPDFLAAVEQFNVSPKLSNSGVPEALRLVPDALAFFASCDKAWFKFVVASHEDIPEIQAIRSDFSLRVDRILLMPEGRTVAELDQSAPAVAEACRQLGLRFCDRLHIRLWGDTRGV